MRSYTVDNDSADLRLEEFLLHRKLLMPRTAIKKAFQKNKIKVNNIAANRNTCIYRNDKIDILDENIFSKDEIVIKPNHNLNLHIITNTNDFVAVNKPSGENCYPLSPRQVDTTLNGIVARFPSAGKTYSNNPMEGGLIHRLDRGTSGILVCALTEKCWSELKSIWKLKLVEKVYVAWVDGVIKTEGMFDLFISHSKKNKKKMIAFSTMPLSQDVKAWKATSSIRPILYENQKTLLLIRIHTGVTHQIRASLSFLGYPVTGDSLYGKIKLNQNIKFRPLLRETNAIFEDLKGHAISWAKIDINRKDFLLHALWLKINSPGLGPLGKGIICPRSFS